MHKNYHYSGMSTPEAIEDFRSHFLAQLPKPIRWLVNTGIIKARMMVCCDGCGRRELFENNPKLVEHGGFNYWQGTEWTHRARLDFCEVCSKNGTADRAVADGAKPLGTYTFDQGEIDNEQNRN